MSSYSGMKPPQQPPPPPPYQPSSYQQQQPSSYQQQQQPSPYQPYGGGYYNPQQQQQQYSQYSHHHNAPPPPHPQQAASGVVQSFDVESQQQHNNNNLYATPFADKYVRAGFIRKTYALLLMQLAFTFGLTFLFVFYPPIRDYIRSPAGMWMFAASWAVGFGTLISLVCCCQAAIRQHPTNLIIMFIFTLAMGFMVATVAAFYNEQAVLIAVGTTFALTLGLTVA
ncbi:protein lifeguard [Pseudoscourfieldia marina]